MLKLRQPHPSSSFDERVRSFVRKLAETEDRSSRAIISFEAERNVHVIILWLMCESPIDEAWHECSFQTKYFISIVFLSAMVDAEGVKATLKVGSARHILLNISEIIEDTDFCVD